MRRFFVGDVDGCPGHGFLVVREDFGDAVLNGKFGDTVGGKVDQSVDGESGHAKGGEMGSLNNPPVPMMTIGKLLGQGGFVRDIHRTSLADWEWPRNTLQRNCLKWNDDGRFWWARMNEEG